MFFKLVLTAVLLSFYASAVTLKPRHDVFIDGNINVIIEYDEGEEMHSNDWIAIYKKGADSSVWANVLHWNWINKLRVEEPGAIYWMLRRTKLPPGEYEARFFKENSYVVDESYAFTVQELDSYVTKFAISTGRPGLTRPFISVSIPNGYSENPQDWVGIYKAGTSNDWENVIDWRWASNIYENGYWYLDEYPLNAGDYEVRYFLNNTYTTHLQFTYHVDEREIPQHESVTMDVEPYEMDNGNYAVRVHLEDRTQNSKNWIGFFKAGEKYVRENIVNWSYNTLENGKGTLDLALVPSEWKGKTLRAVYFENDSYAVMTEVEFTLP